MNVPAKLTIGDSATWTEDAFRDTNGKSFDSTRYALTLELRGPGQPITIVGVPFGPGWQFALTVAQSATLLAGIYYWAAYATAAGEHYTAGTGRLSAVASLAAAGAGYDGRSQDEKDLDTVNLAISARLAGDLVTEYTIGNRSLKKEAMTELLVLRSRLETRVARLRSGESISNGLGNPRRVGVRFSQQ